MSPQRRVHGRGSLILRKALKRHGGSYEAFAHDILAKSRQTIWRWLDNRTPIPAPVITLLTRYLKENRSNG